MEIITLLSLYLLFQLKHFICDFLLQTDWIAINKGNPNKEGCKALLIHCAYHGVGTLLIALLFAPALWWLAFIDFVIHGIIDYIKSNITRIKKWKTTDTSFWWALGVDQAAHHLTHISFIAVIVLF